MKVEPRKQYRFFLGKDYRIRKDVFPRSGQGYCKFSKDQQDPQTLFDAEVSCAGDCGQACVLYRYSGTIS